MNFEKYNLFEECVAKMFSEEEFVVSRQAMRGTRGALSQVN